MGSRTESVGVLWLARRVQRSAGVKRAIAVVLWCGAFSAACGGSSPRPVTLSAQDVRAVRALAAEERAEIEIGARTIGTQEHVAVIESDDSSSRFSPPIPLRAALEEADATGEVHVVFSREASSSSSAATVVDVGSYSALAGGAVAGIGVLMILGAAALGGPAHDHSDVMVGGGVTFLIGTGVATLGGLTALGGYAAGQP